MTKDELCSICYTTELSEEPCVALECGHIFHANCIRQLLKHKWSSLKISFAFLSCPSCKAEIKKLDGVPAIAQELSEVLELKVKVEEEALKVAERQGILESERLKTPGDAYFEQPLMFALHRCSFYQC